MTADTKQKKSGPPRVVNPRSPSLTLQDSYAFALEIYDQAHRNALTKETIARILGHKNAKSGVFKPKLFTLRQYGLMVAEEGKKEFKVSPRILDLRNNEPASPEFRQAAQHFMKSPPVFATLLERYDGRIPAKTVIANQLEHDGFTQDGAEELAGIFLSSLEWGGLLDEAGGSGTPNGESDDDMDGTSEEADHGAGTDEPTPPPPPKAPDGARTLELPTEAGSTVVVRYPRDLSAADADMVASVLKAVSRTARPPAE